MDLLIFLTQMELQWQPMELDKFNSARANCAWILLKGRPTHVWIASFEIEFGKVDEKNGEWPILP